MVSSRHLTAILRCTLFTIIACHDPHKPIVVVRHSGVHQPGTVVQQGFRIKNPSSTPMSILKVIPGCSCAVATLRSHLVPPHDSVVLPVQLSRTKPGVFRKVIMVLTDDKHPNYELVLEGEISPLPAVAPPVLYLDRLRVQGTCSRTVFLRMSEREKPTRIRLHGDHQWISHSPSDWSRNGSILENQVTLRFCLPTTPHDVATKFALLFSVESSTGPKSLQCEVTVPPAPGLHPSPRIIFVRAGADMRSSHDLTIHLNPSPLLPVPFDSSDVKWSLSQDDSILPTRCPSRTSCVVSLAVDSFAPQRLFGHYRGRIYPILVSLLPRDI